MKKALVLGLLILGLGLTASAQLTGYWSTTLTIDPTPVYYFFTGLASTLSVDYALAGWTFGAKAVFDIGGFSSMTFKVAGDLGAFGFVSNMAFDPTFATVVEYEDALCPRVSYATATEPKFLTWDVTASVSIAGVYVEAYVLQDYTHETTVIELGKYYWWDAGLAIPALVQTYSATCDDLCNGMGWRLLLQGSFGPVTISSYTYFGMTELDAYNDPETGCPILGKSGEFEVLCDCDLGIFTEEYLLIEGFVFGCATIDAALSILCDGFNYVQFVVSDISLGGWASLDFALKFTTVSKEWDTCISLNALAFDCFTVELGFGNTGYVDTVIDNIAIHGIKFSHTWGGIKFTSVTEFDAYSTLMSTSTAYTYLYGAYGSFAVPYAGLEWCAKTYFEIADGIYEVYCVALEKFMLWEKFVLDIDADACCGGLFDLTVSTFFGDRSELAWAGYAVWLSGAKTATVVPLYGTVPAGTFPDKTTAVTKDTVEKLSGYVAGDATLFDWAKTEVDLGVGIGSNVKLTFEFDISAFGWEKIGLGFKWSF